MTRFWSPPAGPVPRRTIPRCQRRKSQYHFVEGVATAITPIAFLETVLVKSYETLVDSDTKVDVNARGYGR